MKKGTKTTSTLKLVTLVTLSSVLMLSCTKKRPAAWPDGEAENVYEISVIESQRPTLVLSSEQDVATASLNELQALGESSRLKVESAQADVKLLPLFSNLYVAGQSGQSQSLKLKVGTKFVTAFRVLTDSEVNLLPTLERSILMEQGGEKLLPIFQTEIQEMGVAERTKNDTGEETKTLRIKPTKRAEATHIKFSTLAKDRTVVGVSAASLKNAKEVFLIEKLHGRILNQQELLDLMNIKVARAGHYLVKLEQENGVTVIRLFEIKKFSSLSLKEQNIILAQDQGQKATHLMRCDAALRAERGEDCVMDLSYDLLGAELVSAELSPLDAEGNFSSELSFERARSKSQASLIRVPSQGGLHDYKVGEQDLLSQIDAASILSKQVLEGHEFLMRRTMQDSPNSFDFTFAGSSGPLEIVKFEFEKGRVRVVRADAVLRADGSTAVDRETLLVIPAVYKKVVKTDAQGNPSSMGRLVDTTESDSEALAIVDWTQNSVPTVSSPLDFYELEQCFSGVGERFVSEVDQRLEKEGILNFTLQSTYAGNRGSFDCAGISDAGYFDTVQKNFTFKERISFKKHVIAAGTVEAPELNMPLEAQKKLGFGLFTYIRKKANQSNTPGVVGTEDYVPSIFDIKNGKKITYVLAGLPQGDDARSKEIRERITASTQKVIHDLNLAFKKALAGTPMDRHENVIELIVEGKDISPAKLGDLDRNYIYYVDKATSSGVIGLGGSHANPRSGKVESASVYLYGGNMLATVESLRRLDRARLEYEEGMAGKFKPESDSSESGPSSSGTTSVSPGSTDKVSLPGFKGSVGRIQARVGALGRDLKKEAHVSSDLRSELVKQLPKINARTEKVFGALEAVMSHREFVRADKMARIIQKRESAHSHQHAEDLLSPASRMEKAGICVIEKDLAAIMATGGSTEYDLSKKSDIEILADIWAPTLAHEIGHNLGLRHNFIASVDESNHKFSPEETTKRDYSSVMDYLNDDHITYDGLGPQDVMALRAAYAGKLELTNGKLVGIEDIKKALKLNSWMDLSSDDVAQLPLKKFMFCSDEEAGEMPLCNRFDSGTTPEKIVDFHIKAYRQAYSLANFPNDKIVFGSQNSSSYIGRLFQRFFAIRQMMEETILLASQRKAYRHYLIGAYKGLYFFNQVVRTPELSPLVENRLERFVEVEVDGGKKAVVEAKYLKDIAQDSTGVRLRARGIELDKTIALIALTTRDNSSSRYAEADIQFSLGDLGEGVLSTQGVLKEVLTNSLLPLSQGKDELASLESQDENLERFVPVAGQFRAQVSDLMRVYAVLGAVADLDAPSQDNPSANFRVLSRKDLATDIPFLQTRNAPNDLKFFAYPEAKHSRALVERGFLLQQVLDKKAELVAPLTQWTLLTLKAEKTEEDTATLAKLQETINAVLATLPESVGTRDIAKAAGLVTQVNGIGQQLAPIRPAEGEVNSLYSLLTDNVLIQVESLAKQDSVLALLSEIIGEVAADTENPAHAALKDLKDVFSTAVVSGDQGMYLRNAQLLNQVLLATHREYAQ